MNHRNTPAGDGVLIALAAGFALLLIAVLLTRPLGLLQASGVFALLVGCVFAIFSMVREWVDRSPRR